MSSGSLSGHPPSSPLCVPLLPPSPLPAPPSSLPPCHPCPSGSTQLPIPQPSCLSFNLISLSAYSKSPARRSRITNYLTTMSHIYGCLLLQEVRLFAGEDHYLKQELPHCEIFYNNHPSNTQAHTKNRASTMIIINRSMLKNHTVSPIHLHQDLQGHVQGITNSHTHPPFQLFNVYLPSGDYISMKAMMVHMTKLKNDLHTFMGGDFNFVTSLEDTTSSTLPPLGLRDMWGLVMEHLGLSEATQPIHTQYSITKDPASPHNHSGRLDRWFHSFSEGELALLTPVCSIRSRR